MRELFSGENLGKIYDVYAIDYNRGDSKMPVFNAMLSIAERHKNEMENIELNLYEQCGFEITTWHLMQQESKQRITEAFINWINNTDYSAAEFKEVWDLIFSESERYFEHNANFIIIQWLAVNIPESHYPEKYLYGMIFQIVIKQK